MTDHVEIEQKFDVDEDFERPDFAALPGVTAAAPVVHRLAATYFDTPRRPARREQDHAAAGAPGEPTRAGT